MPDKQYVLESVTVDSVGLVSAGAVSATDEESEKGINFLLIKSQEADMPKELEIEEVLEDGDAPAAEPTLPDQPPDTWQETIKGWLKDMFKAETEKGEEEVSKPDPKALAAAAKVLQGGGYRINPTQLARAMQGMGEEEEDEEDQPMKRKPTKKADGAVAKTGLPDVAIAEVVKAEVEAIKAEYVGVLEELRKSNANLAKQNEELRADLDGLRSDRDVEKAARRRVQAIQKAETLLRLPTSSTDLADLFIKAEDGMGEEDFKKFEALLKAADRQLYTAGLFGEIGTARSPEQVTIEDKVAKAVAEKDLSPEDALLNLSAEDQALLQKEWDEQSRGGK